ARRQCGGNGSRWVRAGAAIGCRPGRWFVADRLSTKRRGGGSGVDRAGRRGAAVAVQRAVAAAGGVVKLRPAVVADAPRMAQLWNGQLGAELVLAERVLALTVFEDPTFRDGDAVLAIEDEQAVGCVWLKLWREPYDDLR